jgi:hypothetical protein
MVKLTPLMQRTSGRAEIVIGLIDGPIAIKHLDLARSSIREISGNLRGSCVQASSAACLHGTFVSGILCARRGAPAPAICPDCTLLVRPIFAEVTFRNGQMPSATPPRFALRQQAPQCVNPTAASRTGAELSAEARQVWLS